MSDDRLLNLRYWRELLARRRSLILGTAVAVTALAGLFSLFQTPLYEGTCRLYLNRQRVQPMVVENMYTTNQPGRPNEQVTTQVEILQSNPILEAAVQDLETRGRLDFRRPSPSGGWLRRLSRHGVDGADARRAAFVEALGKSVSVVPSGGALVAVSVRNTNPRLASELANAIAAAHLKTDRLMLQRSADDAASWLSERVRQQKEKLMLAEEKLRQFSGTPAPPEEMGALAVQEMGRLNEALMDVRLRMLQAETARYMSGQPNTEAARRRAAEAVQEDVKSALRERLRKDLVDVTASLADLKQRYEDQHPDVAAAMAREKQIRDELLRLGPGAGSAALAPIGGAGAGGPGVVGSADLEALRAQERMLRSMQSGVTRGQEGMQFSILKREVEINRSLYNEMLSRLNAITIAAGLDSASAEIFEPARTPLEPVAPDFPRNLMLGLFAGLVLGLGGAAVRDQLDQSVRDTGEANDLLQAPVLGVLPFHKRPAVGAAPQVFVLGSETESPSAEAYRILRAHIDGTLQPEEARILLVTSAVPGEGKSTTAANLAAAYAESGAPVLLVDGDFRRPSLGRYFRVDETKCLSRVLRDGARPENEVQESGVPNLDLLPCGAGRVGADSQQMVQSFTRLFEWAKTRYGHVIVDTPVAVLVPGVTEMAKAGASILLVHRPGWVSSLVLQQVREHLALSNARLAGVVLNAIRTRWIAGQYPILPYYASAYRPVDAPAGREA